MKRVARPAAALKIESLDPIDVIGQKKLRHDSDNEKCWCNPEILQICPEACCPFHKCENTCWKCGGRGIVPEYDACGNAIIIHRDL